MLNSIFEYVWGYIWGQCRMALTLDRHPRAGGDPLRLMYSVHHGFPPARERQK